MDKLKVIITGGGTGGHVFPAIAIADAIKERVPDAEILFVGAQGKLEMQKVPQAGYKIVGLPVRGLQRKLTLKNIVTLIKLVQSIFMARKTVKKFKPSVVVGVGGYASAPVLHVAAKKKIPIVLQEQNSYPGVTNKMFARHAAAICVAYEENLKYFPKDKVVITGNPLRTNLLDKKVTREEALEYFGFSAGQKVIFVTGGSLGARTLNTAVEKGLDKLVDNGVKVIWQCGKYYYNELKERLGMRDDFGVLTAFIEKMEMAYAAADLVIARAGAITVSELALLGKAVIFVPSPNVAEDHQTKNAKALVDKNAALMVPDNKAEEILVDTAVKTVFDKNKLNELQENIKKFAKPDAAAQIADIVINNAKK